MKVMKLVLATLFGILAMGIVATGAQAQTWLVEGKSLTELKQKEEKFTVANKGTITLSVPALKATIKCEKAEGSGKIFEAGTDELTLTLLSCSAAEFSKCKVEPIKLEAKTKLVQSSNSVYEEIEPKEKAFGTVTITGAGCALPEKSSLTGLIIAETPLEELVERPVTMSEAITSKAKEELKTEFNLKFGAQAAKLSGEYLMKLSGADIGEAWQPEVITKLCHLSLQFCTAGETYETGTEITLVSEVQTRFEFTQNVVCTGSTLQGSNILKEGAQIFVWIETATFGPCVDANNNACTVTGTGTPWSIGVTTRSNAKDGNALLNNGSIELVCGLTTCNYNVSTLSTPTFLLKGGSGATPPKMSSPLIPMDKAGVEMGCANSGFWKGVPAGSMLKYEFIAPTELFVTS